MVIVKLMGGLGNQLFQYAAARRIALKHDTEVAFDMSWFQNTPPQDTHREFELNHFNISARIASPIEIAEIGGSCDSFLLKALLRLGTITGLCRYHQYRFDERELGYQTDLSDLNDNVYLHGYWQSELYFKDIEDTIRNDFSFKSAPFGSNLSLIKRLVSKESVAIHFRRGDYDSNPLAAGYHGYPGHSYYYNAMKIISDMCMRPRFYVFSDDPEWVKREIVFPIDVEYVTHNLSKDSYEDLRLMTNCKHVILANSSFSWWGGWLGSNPDRIVIAPKRWFAGKPSSAADIIPSRWISI